MPTAKLEVRGLAGHADEARVEDALRGIAGVYGAQVSHEGGCAEVDYEDDEVALEALLETVRELGFEAGLAG